MDVEDILSKVKIEDYIGQYVELEEESGELFGRCPLHSEETPSFSVTPENGLWWCFGCHKGGNVLTFIEQYHHTNFAQALQILCKYAGISENYTDKRLSATKIIRKFKRDKLKTNNVHVMCMRQSLRRLAIYQRARLVRLIFQTSITLTWLARLKVDFLMGN